MACSKMSLKIIQEICYIMEGQVDPLQKTLQEFKKSVEAAGAVEVEDGFLKTASADEALEMTKSSESSSQEDPADAGPQLEANCPVELWRQELLKIVKECRDKLNYMERRQMKDKFSPVENNRIKKQLEAELKDFLKWTDSEDREVQAFCQGILKQEPHLKPLMRIYMEAYWLKRRISNSILEANNMRDMLSNSFEAWWAYCSMGNASLQAIVEAAEDDVLAKLEAWRPLQQKVENLMKEELLKDWEEYSAAVEGIWKTGLKQTWEEGWKVNSDDFWGDWKAMRSYWKATKNAAA